MEEPDEFPKQKEAEYLHALGRFMHNFALLEVCINDIIVTLFMDEFDTQHRKIELTKAAMGGFRFSVARDTLKRLLRITNADEATRSEVDRVLSHVGEIHFLRDRLAHNAAGPTKLDGLWWFGCTNRVNIRELKDLEILYFTVEMLNDAADDLSLAEQCITNATDAIQKVIEKMAVAADPSFQPPSTEQPPPWRYKPSLLRRGGPKSRRSQQSHQRRPEPSEQ